MNDLPNLRNPKWLTVREAIRLSGYSRSWLRRLGVAGKIHRSLYAPRLTFYLKEDVERLAYQHQRTK
jgi:hypothetical protein